VCLQVLQDFLHDAPRKCETRALFTHGIDWKRCRQPPNDFSGTSNTASFGYLRYLREMESEPRKDVARVYDGVGWVVDDEDLRAVP